MSAFSGPQGKGAAQRRRAVKRAEASVRDARYAEHKATHRGFGFYQPECVSCQNRAATR